MLWLLAALLAGYALFLPVTLTVCVHHHEQTKTRLELRFAGLHKTWGFTGFPGTQPTFRKSRGQRLLSMLRHSDMAKRFLREHTHLVRLDALILLRTGDAARTALLTGAIRSVASVLQHRRQVCICIQPDFFHPHSTANVRCIIRWKLGTLLLTTGMLLAETLIQQRLTESEAT